MWCEHCRQNVTGMVSQAQDCVCCSRCGCALPGGMPGESNAGNSSEADGVPEACAPLPCPAEVRDDASSERPSAPSPALPRPDAERWDMEEDLRHIERLLRRDGAHRELSTFNLGTALATDCASLSPASGATARDSASSVRAGIAWLLLCAGLAATACGLMLLAWHFFAHRADLLTPGLACAAAGQLVLLCGFLILPSAGSEAPPRADASHPAQWLEVHRRIDEMLRADLPGETDHQEAYAPRSPTSPPR
jgi:hypothetical protein